MYLYYNAINVMNEVCIYIAMSLMLWTRYFFYIAMPLML